MTSQPPKEASWVTIIFLLLALAALGLALRSCSSPLPHGKPVSVTGTAARK
jgi:hypothetical protein